MKWTTDEIIQWMDKTNEKIQTNKEYLSSLDRAIGDGDHGINMARGFKVVVEKIHDTSYANISQLLKDIAMTIIHHVGGASGPLYGTAFLRFSLATKQAEVIDTSIFAKGMMAAVAGLKQRGRAMVGEKTLIDVWEPVTLYIKETETIASNEIKRIAKEAMEKTKSLQATKGRAAYLKERSIGHVDPGAMSSYYMFLSLAEVLEGGGRG